MKSQACRRTIAVVDIYLILAMQFRQIVSVRDTTDDMSASIIKVATEKGQDESKPTLAATKENLTGKSFTKEMRAGINTKSIDPVQPRPAFNAPLDALKRGKSLKNVLATMEGAKVYDILKPPEPFQYETFLEQFTTEISKLEAKLAGMVTNGTFEKDPDMLIAIDKIRQFYACRSKSAMETDTSTAGMFKPRWDQLVEEKGNAWTLNAVETALAAERMVNRVHVCQNEIETNQYFRTMNIVAQTFVLAVLIPTIRDTVLPPALKEPRKPIVVFAGCGLGDWAVELYLYFKDQLDVTCSNYNYPTMIDGKNLIEDTDIAFNSTTVDSDIIAKAQDDEHGVHYLCHSAEANLYGVEGPLCLYAGVEDVPQYEHDQSRGGFPTFQLAAWSTNVFPDGIDVVIYGNALTAEEVLANVVPMLKDDNSFALIPLCTQLKPPEQPGKGANCYCEGVYYKFFKTGTPEGPLFPFGHVMRPWGTESILNKPNDCIVKSFDIRAVTGDNEFVPEEIDKNAGATHKTLKRINSMASIDRNQSGGAQFDG